MYYKKTPQFEFGYGLSYTTFSLTWFTNEVYTAISLFDIVSGHTLPQYQVNVTNTGSVTSDVSVLAFIDAPENKDPDTPIQQLFDFQRVSQLAPNTTVTLFFTATVDSIALVGQDGTAKVTKGKRRIRIGFPMQEFLITELNIL